MKQTILTVITRQPYARMLRKVRKEFCQVRTGMKNHRRLMILKDSFGNAIPGYLFYSFEEIHVVDYRYFGRNMKKYVEENKITDILFANNIFNAYSPKI